MEPKSLTTYRSQSSSPNISQIILVHLPPHMIRFYNTLSNATTLKTDVGLANLGLVYKYPWTKQLSKVPQKKIDLKVILTLNF
jgi:hypothetical protein